MNCSIARSLDQVGDWWSLLIVRELTQGATRFDQFQAALGIARNILTTRLARLVEVGIVERFALATRANTFGYRLTDKGEDLYPVLISLMQWGDKWIAPQGKALLTLVADASGEPIERMAVKTPGGPALRYRDVRFTPGPGAKASTRQAIKQRNTLVLDTDTTSQ